MSGLPFLRIYRVKPILFCVLSALVIGASFTDVNVERDALKRVYTQRIDSLSFSLGQLKSALAECAENPAIGKEKILRLLHRSRICLKRTDFWLRYTDPIHYRWINGPLPIEWETEVFEKYEAPYMRRAGGLILMETELALAEPNLDSLLTWCDMAGKGLTGLNTSLNDLDFTKPDWFLFANRHFLLNLFTVYSTGYECPSEDRRIPELHDMCQSMQEVYAVFSKGNPDLPMDRFNELYERMLAFLTKAPEAYMDFDHYAFIRDYVAPLYEINAGLIRSSRVRSQNLNDYSLQSNAISLFDPGLYNAQNRKGVFSGIEDSASLASIRSLGSMLFYDPILSGNMERSCASCHKPAHFFADTQRFASNYDRNGFLARNTPSLFQASSNHLLMADGAHFSLQEQARHVIGHVKEMAGDEAVIMKRINKIPQYRKQLQVLSQLTPSAPVYSYEHVLSAVVYYCSSYGDSIPLFFRQMKHQAEEDALAIKGFNLFMGKAACATCHFLPRFNGVRPPYTGSEFEVIGTPADKAGKVLSSDSGRFLQHPVAEMLHAFRTPGLWNIGHTFPYMHNGVYHSLEEVIDFYDAGGGIGKGLKLANQTLPSDSLRLSQEEKQALVHFLRQLKSEEPAPTAPLNLPQAQTRQLSARKPGGNY